jgi:arylsulfatase A-like enzyme
MAFWERNQQGNPVEADFRKSISSGKRRAPMAMKDLPGRSLKDWVRQYHQGVLAIDEGVGRLLQALLDSGQDENTLIVFTSDQGFAWGQKGFKSKVAPYDSTILAPLIFRLPKSARNFKTMGSVVRAPVGGVDLVPTFFKWANLDLPWKMHGHDLTPLLLDSKVEWKHPSLLVHTAKQYGSDADTVPSKGDPKLIHGPGIPWYVMLMDGKMKYIRTLIEGEIEELYDLDHDPEELHNLAYLPEFKKALLKFRNQAIEELKRTDAKMVNHLPKVASP